MSCSIGRRAVAGVQDEVDHISSDNLFEFRITCHIWHGWLTEAPCTGNNAVKRLIRPDPERP